jgi:hypothetical protein
MKDTAVLDTDTAAVFAHATMDQRHALRNLANPTTASSAGHVVQVAAAAEALDWPLLTLSPPVFLSRGIEGFEAAAGAEADGQLWRCAG